MGRYPLIVYFYNNLAHSKQWQNIGHRVLIGRAKWTHIGVSIGQAHFFFTHTQGSVVTTNKAVFKFMKPHTLLFLGNVDITIDRLRTIMPKYTPYSKWDMFLYGLVKFFPWVKHLGYTRPKLCGDGTCEVLNGIGIPIPPFDGYNLEKIRRWLHENNFVLWESRYRQNNNSKGTDGPSV
jgi:hypothetical protein